MDGRCRLALDRRFRAGRNWFAGKDEHVRIIRFCTDNCGGCTAPMVAPGGQDGRRGTDSIDDTDLLRHLAMGALFGGHGRRRRGAGTFSRAGMRQVPLGWQAGHRRWDPWAPVLRALYRSNTQLSGDLRFRRQA